jgi:hypothetical protein
MVSGLRQDRFDCSVCHIDQRAHYNATRPPQSRDQKIAIAVLRLLLLLSLLRLWRVQRQIKGRPEAGVEQQLVALHGWRN